MRSKIAEKNFRKKVWEQGFSFEHDALVFLQDHSWEVLPNRFFNSNGVTKEYDLLAVKKNIYKNSFKFSIVLIIECKYNPHRIVFYTRKLKNDSYPLAYTLGSEFEKQYNFEDIKSIFKNLKQYTDLLFSEDQTFGYQAFDLSKIVSSGKKKGDKKNNYECKVQDGYSERSIFKAIDSVISAVQFEKNIRESKKQIFGKELTIFFPIALFSGNLFNATINKKKKIIKEDSYFRYKTGKVSSDGVNIQEYYVYVVDMRGFEKIIRFCSQIFSKFSNSIENKLKVTK